MEPCGLDWPKIDSQKLPLSDIVSDLRSMEQDLR
jgi:hypothetical protein